jgi:hypothetical protein
MNSRPLHIYLDMNKWIALAQAYHNRSAGAQFQEVLECVRRAVREGRAVFPLSDIHILEARKRRDLESQRRLLTVMWEFSQGWALAPTRVLVEQQLEVAVARLFEQPTPIVDSPFGRGPVFAYGLSGDLLRDVGGDAERASQIQETFTTLRGLDRLLQSHATAGASQAAQLFQLRLDQAANDNQTRRQDAQPATRVQRKGDYVRDLLQHPRLLAILTRNGQLEAFGQLEQAEFVQFFGGVPTLDVEIELLTESNEHLDRLTQPNDIADVTFLSAAIPYCDIVVTERYWVNIATRKGVGEKYGTTLLSNLNDLIPILCGEGE